MPIAGQRAPASCSKRSHDSSTTDAIPATRPRRGKAPETIDFGSACLCGDRQETAVAALDIGSPIAPVDCLRLGRIGDEEVFLLTNIITREKVRLEGACDLVVDEHLGGALIAFVGPGGELVAREPDGLLCRTVYENSAGERFIRERKDSGEISTWSLGAMECRFKAACVSVNVGGGCALTTFSTFVFMRARGLNCRCFWDTTAIYKHLGLKCYKGFPGRWVSRAKPSWLRSWCGLVGDQGAEQLVYSVDDQGESKFIDSLRALDRCLPATSISTFALLANCLRWYAASQNKGGLMERNCRSVAKSLFSALARGLGATDWSFDFMVGCKWASSWPRPGPPCDDASVVRLHCSGGIVDLAPLRGIAASVGFAVAKRVWPALAAVSSHDAAAPLATLCKHCVQNEKLQGFLGQLLVAMTTQLDVVLGAHVRGAVRRQSHGPVSMVWLDRRWQHPTHDTSGEASCLNRCMQRLTMMSVSGGASNGQGHPDPDIAGQRAALGVVHAARRRGHCEERGAELHLVHR